MKLYEYTARMAELFGLLQDEKSRSIFWDRLKCDVQPSLEYIADLYADAFDMTSQQRQIEKDLAKQARQFHAEGKKLFLYGAGGCGQAIAEAFQIDNIPYTGFCDVRAAQLKEVYGKPVYPPEYLFSHAEECYVLVTASVFFDEILEVLKSNHFPEDHILRHLGNGFIKPTERQYFAFPNSYRQGTAFVDAGSFNAEDSLYFAEWCGRNYSKIFAFEPDQKNAQRCRDAAEKSGLRDFNLVPAAMSSKSGNATFSSSGNAISHLVDTGSPGEFFYTPTTPSCTDNQVQVVALDDVVKDTVVGFIKMDIEGAELDALCGGERTIKRDKPLLAICVYHRKGDTLAIMDYLHTIVPEYRFWIRHYTAMQVETVLYAAVPEVLER